MKLEAREVTVCYGRNTALEKVSLTVRPHEWWMVAGPNGAGKSTLAKVLSRSVPFSGKLYLDEVEAKCIPNLEFAQKVGMLTQNHASTYGFSVAEVVSLGRYAWRGGYFRGRDPEGKGKIREALRQTGLEGMEHRSLLTLSGGELQRVFLAQVLAQNPQVLILDEPTNHLDLPFQKQLFELVGKWLEAGDRAVVTVMHDLTLARSCGTHALLLDRGRCAACGPVREALSRENLRRVYGMDVQEWMRDMLSEWTEEDDRKEP